MKRYLVLVLKGMAYGITHLVPGIGGGLILILMGIYEEFVEAVGNLFIRRDRWRVYIPFLFSLGVGTVIAALGFAKVISGLLERYPAPTMLFFIGLLLGTIPGIIKMHGDMRFTGRRGVALLAGLAVVVVMREIQRRGLHSGSSADVTSLSGIIYDGMTSFVAGAASVTPGMDGSYIFLLAGTYEPIMNALDALTRLVIQWGILVPTLIGAALGIISFSKLADTAIKRAPSLTYYAVLGLIGGSIYGLWPEALNAQNAVISFVGLVVGAAIALAFARPAQREAEPTTEPGDDAVQP